MFFKKKKEIELEPAVSARLIGGIYNFPIELMRVGDEIITREKYRYNLYNLARQHGMRLSATALTTDKVLMRRIK